MSKETLLKEFEERFVHTDQGDGRTEPPSEFIEMGCVDSLKHFISQAIDQTREETLAVPYNVSEWKRIGQERKYWDYFKQDIREEIIRVAMERIEQIKSAIAKNTGSYKYDSCYDDCLNVLQSLINLRSK